MKARLEEEKKIKEERAKALEANVLKRQPLPQLLLPKRPHRARTQPKRLPLLPRRLPQPRLSLLPQHIPLCLRRMQKP